MFKRHGAREQKRLAKQKAKRAARHRQLAMRSSPDPYVRLRAADRWPVIECLVPENLREAGLGNLLMARRMPDGQSACAVFLVDVFCLGVKDALWSIVHPAQFAALRKDIESHGRLMPVTPEHFAKLVYQAADYGQSLGFPPHRDFRHAQLLLAGIDPSQCDEQFEFGFDGQPLYIQGPSESIGEVRSIINRLQALGGEFLVQLDPSEVPEELATFDDEEDEFEEDEHDDEIDVEIDVEEDIEEDIEEDDQVQPSRWLRLPWRSQ